MQQQIEERGIRTFKVEAKRADKSFPVKSPEIARRIGAEFLSNAKYLKWMSIIRNATVRSRPTRIGLYL